MRLIVVRPLISLLLIVGCGIPLLSIGQLPGGIYTINGSSPTAGSNFANFQDAATALLAGITGPVVINVQPNGTNPFYNEQVKFKNVPGSSVINTITINGGGNQIKFNSTSTVERAVVKMENARHYRITNLNIDASGGVYGYGIQFTTNADSNEVSNCVITSSTTATTDNFAGIVFNSSTGTPSAANTGSLDNNRISGNQIIGGFYGIISVGNSSFPNARNTIVDNDITEFYSIGIYVSLNPYCFLKNNRFNRISRTNANTSVYGILVTTGASPNLTISGNIFGRFFPIGDLSNITAAGIIHNEADALGGSNYVFNNVIFLCGGKGPKQGIRNIGSDSIRYLHNTVSLGADDKTSVSANTGFAVSSAASSIVFRNNLINVHGAGQLSYAVSLASGFVKAQLQSDNNNLHVYGNSVSVGNGYATLADWRTGTGFDLNSVSLDPMFQDSLGGFLKPAANALNNLGSAAGISEDVVGLNRPAVAGTNPDIGAYEFDSSSCPSPLLPGHLIAPAGSFCLDNPIQFQAAGFSRNGATTFQWQRTADSLSGLWNNIGSVQYNPALSTTASMEIYYRLKLSCGPDSVFTYVVYHSFTNPLQGGTYTIDSTQATTNPMVPGGNFRSPWEAVQRLECGIIGKVVFNIAPSPSGAYRGQIKFDKVPGASQQNNITFQSANGSAASVVFYNDSSSYESNFTILFNGAENINLKNITVKSGNHPSYNPSYGRAIVFAGRPSNDSILNCVINVPDYSSASASISGIFGDVSKSSRIALIGNTITGGSVGIFFKGANVWFPAHQLTIQNNQISSCSYQGIYTNYTTQLEIRANNIVLAPSSQYTSAGIYVNRSDSTTAIARNNVSIVGAIGNNSNGIFLDLINGWRNNPLLVEGNTIVAVNGHTAKIQGLYINFNIGSYSIVKNNAISVKTTSLSSYGIIINNCKEGRFLNNSVLNASTGTTDSYAAAFLANTGDSLEVRNNIFSHGSVGRALFVANSDKIKSDYNLLHTNGTILTARTAPVTGGTSFSDIHDWRAASQQDLYSLSGIRPAFVNDSILRPDVTKDSSWALHGRGVQVRGNSYDIDGAARPDDIEEGTPDLGAYEFAPPAVLPPVLKPAINSLPAANVTQAFMLGTDTVMKIGWGNVAPFTVQVRRHSGVVPSDIPGQMKHMDFYNSLQMDTGNTYQASVETFYLPSWKRKLILNDQLAIARTSTIDTAWLISYNSKPGQREVVTSESFAIANHSRTTIADNPLANAFVGASNEGRKFWAPYGHMQSMAAGVNTQEMVFYFAARKDANVTVRVNGTTWVKNYFVPAGTVKLSDFIPKDGSDDARILDEGVTSRGVEITSDVAIAAFSQAYWAASSGASMLIPVERWGKEYVTSNSDQVFAPVSYSWFAVMADEDSTKIEIKPSVASKLGVAANVPFTVQLNKGQVYSFFGSTQQTDVTGCWIKSVPNSQGKCYPVAVFSGSSRTQICASGGDNYAEQNFPYETWGKRYASFGTVVGATSPTGYNSNMYRVLVKDTTTKVYVNGTLLSQSTLINGNHYRFVSPAGTAGTAATYIEADKPVQVTQLIIGSANSNCVGASVTGYGDPGVVYLTPLEQAVTRSSFASTNLMSVQTSAVNLVLPAAGLASLKIDNQTTFSHVFDHPYLPGYKCVRQNITPAIAYHAITCDLPFTGVSYGLAPVESYIINVGANFENLNDGLIVNLPEDSIPKFCSGGEIRFKLRLKTKPLLIKWKFSEVEDLMSNQDSVQLNPLPLDSTGTGLDKVYVYQIANRYNLATAALLQLPVDIEDPAIPTCGNITTTTSKVRILPQPANGFKLDYSGCIADTATLTAYARKDQGYGLEKLSWIILNDTIDKQYLLKKTFPATGLHLVRLTTTTEDGCTADTVQQVTVQNSIIPTVSLKPNSHMPGNITITAVATGADGDAVYTFMVNGISVQSGTSATYTSSTLVAGDVITVQLNSNASCASPAIVVSQPLVVGSFRFVGSGDWEYPGNWEFGLVPPSVLPAGMQVTVTPSAGGQAIINGSITIQPGGKLLVEPGKKLVVNGNIIQ